jgi:hypothetical protein
MEEEGYFGFYLIENRNTRGKSRKETTESIVELIKLQEIEETR